MNEAIEELIKKWEGEVEDLKELFLKDTTMPTGMFHFKRGEQATKQSCISDLKNLQKQLV